jgi:hypothetical protein
MRTVLLSPGGYPIAVNKYIISYQKKVRVCGKDSSGLGQEKLEGSCERSNGPSRYRKYTEFDYRRNCYYFIAVGWLLVGDGL